RPREPRERPRRRHDGRPDRRGGRGRPRLPAPRARVHATAHRLHPAPRAPPRSAPRTLPRGDPMTSPDDRARRARLREVFDPVFARIAEGAVERELARTLPFEPVQWLREVRFGALRVPEELGGWGASTADLL